KTISNDEVCKRNVRGMPLQLPMLSCKARPITLLTGNGDTAASHCRGCTPHRTTGRATHFACPRLNPTLLAAPHQHSSWLRARMFILVNHDDAVDDYVGNPSRV